MGFQRHAEKECPEPTGKFLVMIDLEPSSRPTWNRVHGRPETEFTADLKPSSRPTLNRAQGRPGTALQLIRTPFWSATCL